MRSLPAAILGLLLAASTAAAQDDLTPPPSTGGRVMPTETAAGAEPETMPEAGTDEDSLADALGDPRHDPTRVRSEPARELVPEEEWKGPNVELGYTHFNLYDAFEGGDVHAGTFGGFLPFAPIRLGGWVEIGVRQYSLGDDDFLLRANIIAGYQYLGWRPFAPYAGATASVGVVFGQRFGSPEASGFGGGGIELGAEINLVKNLWFGLSLGYQRVSLAGSGFDLWVFRVRTGL